MPLVPAKCTQCGANIQVDSKLDAAVCDSCGTPFIVEKAIQHYHTTNITNVSAGVVNVVGGLPKEDRINAADTFYKMKDYNKAFELYEKIATDYPDDYRGWWGQARAYTSGLLNLRYSVYTKAKEFFDKACYFTTDEEKEKIASEFESYSKKALKEYSKYYSAYTAKRNATVDNIKGLDKKMKIMKKPSIVVGIIALVVWLLAIIFKNSFAVFFFGGSVCVISWIGAHAFADPAYTKKKHKLMQEREMLVQRLQGIDWEYKRNL